MSLVDSGRRPRPASGVVAPALWVCPTCSSRVRTHVPTYTPECRHSSHRNKVVFMEVSSGN